MFYEKKRIFLKSLENLEGSKPIKEVLDFHTMEFDPLKQIDDLVNKADQQARKLELIEASKAHLKELREKGVFPEDKKWAATANAEAFFALANTLYDTPATRELFQREELNIVYPAGRMHLSPLEMGIRMAEKTDKTKKINFTYTEIDQEAYAKIDELVKIYVKNTPNLSNFRVESLEPADKKDWKSPRFKKMRFELKTSSGRTVEFELNYEYRMAGEKYIREEAAAKADLWILHDTDDGEKKYSKAKSNAIIFFDNFSPAKNANKKIFAIVESPTDRPKAENELIYSSMGKSVAQQEGFSIGCGESHWDDPRRQAKDKNSDEMSKTAKVIEIDTEKLEEINRLGGKAGIEGYFKLVIKNNASIFRQIEVFNSLLKVYKLTTNNVLKKEIENGARESLKNGAYFIRENNWLLNENIKILMQIGGISPEEIKQKADDQLNELSKKAKTWETTPI